LGLFASFNVSSVIFCSYVPPIVLTNDSKDGEFDGVIVVTDALEHVPASLQSAQSTLNNYLKVSTDCLHCIAFCIIVLAKVILSKLVADCRPTDSGISTFPNIYLIFALTSDVTQ